MTFCNQLNHALVSETLVALAERGKAEALAQPLLQDVQQYRPHVRIDSSARQKVMSELGSDMPMPPPMKGKGKGEGKGKGKFKGGSRY